MSGFNLDVDAYRDSELEDLMRLTIPYSHKDVTDAKEVLLRQLTTDAELSPERKGEITFFIDSIANRITNIASKRYKEVHRPHQKPHDEGTWAEKKVPTAQYGSNIIIKNPNEIVGKHAKITGGRLSMEGRAPPGYINPINVRTTARAINIDSRFRPNYYKTPSTKFSMHLPAIEKRVVKMTVGALEIPLTYHAISENLGNNRCLIIDNCSNFYPDPSGWLVKLPDGNYGTNELKGSPGSSAATETDIEIAMNNAIATADAGTVNINTGNFTLTGGVKLDPAWDVCYRWDRISGRSVFACPGLDLSCSGGGGGGGGGGSSSGIRWVDRGVGPQSWGDISGSGAIASNADGDKLAAVVYNGNVWLSTNYGVTWTESLGTTKAWTSITSNSDGTRLYATVGKTPRTGGTGGNLWYSHDSGGTWIAQGSLAGENQAWLSIATNEDGSAVVATSTATDSGVPPGGRIWKSIDFGVNWLDVTPGGVSRPWRAVTSSYDGSATANTKFAVTVYGGNIWKSTNAGNNWSEINGGPGSNQPPLDQDWWGIASDSTGSYVAAVVYGGNIWTTLNPGGTWTERTGGIGSPTPNQNWRDIASNAGAATSSASILTAVVDGGSIWKSNDGGASWVEDTTVGTSKNWVSVASNATGDQLAAVVDLGDIWTWPPTSAELDVWTDRSLAGAGGGPADWPGNLGSIPNNLGGEPAIASNRSGDKLWAVSNGGFIYKSIDSGVNWTQVASVQTWASIASDSAGLNLAAAVQGGNIWLSPDGGDTWNEQTGLGAPAPNENADWRSIASNDLGTVLIAATYSWVSVAAISAVWVSIDSGVNWTLKFDWDGGAGAFGFLRVTSNDDGTRLATLARGSIAGNTYDVWTSDDSPAFNTWVRHANTPGSFAVGFCADKSGMKFFVAVYNGSIGRSLDGGSSWLALVSGNVPTPPDPNLKWRSIATDDTGTTVVAGGEAIGIWISLDGGQNWNNTTYSPSLTFSSFNFASNGDGTVLAALEETDGPIWTVGTAAAPPTPVVCDPSYCMDFIVRFTIDKTGNLNMNDSIQFKLGWPLGFRAGEYLTSGAAVSEGICFVTGPRYGFLAINDYQKNRGKAYMLAFSNSSLDENIMVRLNLAAVQDEEGIYKSANDPGLTTTMNTSRDYFGPVDIQKLTITLYDEYGRVMDLNNMDWSFTITLERLYD